ncbi:MAG: DoxX family protein [Desulfomicrobium sp.]|jgi:putative oxidoreductase|nr:DoxX family protein [Desulfomicrobium sp.]
MARGGAALANAVAPLFIRIPLGLVFMAHGSQKLLGLFGGKGLTATLRIFEEQMGIPPLFTLLAIIAEFGGGIGVLAGFLTRVSASGIAVVMAVAIYKVHWGHGFFINQAGQGIEFTLALLGMAMFLVIDGGGRWCVDRLIFKG